MISIRNDNLSTQDKESESKRTKGRRKKKNERKKERGNIKVKKNRKKKCFRNIRNKYKMKNVVLLLIFQKSLDLRY